MLDFEVLRSYGTTDERLRQICTAEQPSDPLIDEEESERIARDIRTRERWLKRIQGRTREGIVWSLQNWRLWGAVDMAWDSSPINKERWPLMMMAQGLIDKKGCLERIKDLSCADRYIRKDEDGNPVDIDLPRFVEGEFNLIRSVVTRRMAAQVNLFNSLWPFYEYHSNSTGLPSKIKAQVASLLADTMADQFGWREHLIQVIRDVFLYSRCIDFVRASWEVCEEWRKQAIPEGMETDGEIPVESVVRKQGICWVNPHPSRVFWDHAYPIWMINPDVGPTFIGHWDVKRYRDVKRNPYYFNREKIGFGADFWSHRTQYLDYFNQYLCNVKSPIDRIHQKESFNDRESSLGIYSGENDDDSVFLTEYYEKMIPADEGIGSYPYEVWVRFTLASDDTIVHAEIMPSSPAVYYGHNEKDSRLVNLSVAMELMPAQDQLTNQLNHLVNTIETSQIKVVTLNKDILEEPDLDAVLAQFRSTNYSKHPIMVPYSFSKRQDLLGTGGAQPEIMRIVQPQLSQNINDLIRSMVTTMEFTEKLQSMSPNEQGQPSPRETSATEANLMASTTSSVYSFISSGINLGRAAAKRVVFESIVSCWKGDIRVPLGSRFSEDVIEEAGFRVVDRGEEIIGDAENRRVLATIEGAPDALNHDMIFSSRDGTDRPSNIQAATVLTQLLGQMITIPTVLEKMGRRKLYEMINEVFRLSGTGFDIKLEVDPGEDDSFGPGQAEEVQQQMQQLAQAVESNSNDNQQLQEVVQGLAEELRTTAQLVASRG